MYTKRWLQIQFITKPNNPGNILKETQAGNMQLHDSCYHRETSKKKGVSSELLPNFREKKLPGNTCVIHAKICLCKVSLCYE